MLNLDQCAKTCVGCIKQYKGKHELKRGQKFDIQCEGITDFEDPQLELFQGLSEDETKTARSILDPVEWARQTIDWHCLDEEGEVWKRKNPKEYNRWVKNNPDGDITGHSRYHRPYQAEMLRCTSKRKVFRIGRQAGKTECLIVSMLFHMFTKPDIPENDGFQIIVIAPYQAQIDLIFGRLLQLIRTSPLTRNSLRRHVKAPIYTIELHNNSIVKGFTAGTKSGGNAEAVRGQHGHMLVFDEADYLSASDVEAALNIVTNYPDASIWMSSTPTGKRERFYTTCLSKIWKEYHYPSQVNPVWDHNQEIMFREQMSDLAFKHEILAQFGEQEEGVFQNVYIQQARQDYKYGDIPYRSSWIYTIGVDWNDVKNGTTIIVLGYDPSASRFFIVDKAVVSREGWNQLAACQKVAEFNRVWKPRSIYLDSGYGGTQYEVLRKYGYDSAIDPTKGPQHPDAKLRTVLKQYDFGSKVEVRDLFTKQPVNKPAKPFLVENAVRRFEQSDICFPKSDTDLEAQLLGYVIDRITPTGTPVYKASDEGTGDHLLDALMLACVAFTLEQTPFGKPLYSSHIAFSGNFGDSIPTAEPGETIIKPDPAFNKRERETHRPSMNRTEVVERTSLLEVGKRLPANHTTSGRQISLWSYSGSEDPGNAPRTRSLNEAEKDARRRQGIKPKKAGRPKRKNI